MLNSHHSASLDAPIKLMDGVWANRVMADVFVATRCLRSSDPFENAFTSYACVVENF